MAKKLNLHTWFTESGETIFCDANMNNYTIKDHETI